MSTQTEAKLPSVQITPPQQITARTLTLLERQVDDAIARRASVVEILCAGVQVVDSGGLNWLLTALSRLEVAGVGLKLVDPSAILGDILIATRLEGRFAIERKPKDGGGVHG